MSATLDARRAGNDAALVRAANTGACSVRSSRVGRTAGTDRIDEARELAPEVGPGARLASPSMARALSCGVAEPFAGLSAWLARTVTALAIPTWRPTRAAEAAAGSFSDGSRCEGLAARGEAARRD